LNELDFASGVEEFPPPPQANPREIQAMKTQPSNDMIVLGEWLDRLAAHVARSDR